MKTQICGKYHEHQAKKFLMQQGFCCLCENFRSAAGEIDLIMQKAYTLIFVEVRYRQKSHYGSALESVTPGKQTRIKKTATYFLSKHKHYQHYFQRFDIIAVEGPHMHWIQNSFS